ncbi:alpha-ketoglutarate-dependent dioxygenase AlkB [Pseudomonas oryzihabitans]|nr:alpha-ketoglutarate-dependent dioxygenase AlkB [Pseudomonas oryzihabitans]
MEELLINLSHIIAQSPLRNMTTASGRVLSASMTNCGTLGWLSDRFGYRYSAIDPLTNGPWPGMPNCYSRLATIAACLAGYDDFIADSCLINKYKVGAGLSLHQDKCERDLSFPTVSVSLGMSAFFLLGGLAKNTPVAKIQLNHGDVVVLCGIDRLRVHGITPVHGSPHDLLDHQRISLNFRHAG